MKAFMSALGKLVRTTAFKLSFAYLLIFTIFAFGGLGYVTKVRGAMLGAQKSINEEDVVVFNIYGAAAKNSKETFGDTDA